MADSKIAITMSSIEHNNQVQENTNKEHKQGIANTNFQQDNDGGDDISEEVSYEPSGRNKFMEHFPLARRFIFNGILNVTWNAEKNKYVNHSWKFLFFYAMWFLAPIGWINLSPFLFKDYDATDKLINPVFSMLCIVVPSLQVYTLHSIHLHAKGILQHMDQLPVPKTFQGKWLKKHFRRLFIGTKKIKYLVSIVPRLVLILALMWWVATFIYYFIIYQIPLFIHIEGEEWWYFMITGIYALLPMFTLEFIWSITHWMAEIYKDMYEAYGNKLTKKKAKILRQKYSVVTLQSLFNELREITRYGVSITFIMIFFCALHSTIELIGNKGNLLYLIPFTGTLLPLAIFCRSAGRLIDMYEKLLYVIKKKSLEDQELSPILQETASFLELAEPRMFVLGGFYVGFSLTFTLIGFIFTYSSLILDGTKEPSETTPGL